MDEPRRSRLRTLCLSVVATALGLLALEGAARLAAAFLGEARLWQPGTVSRHAVDPGLAGSPEYGWIRQPGFRGKYVTHPRAYDAEGYRALDSAQVHASGGAKVVFIGDSNTYGYDVADEATFVEVMERSIPGCAAINLGTPGYSSFQGWLVAKEYLPRLTPKVAVISFNYNDRRYTFFPPGPDGPERSREVDRLTAAPWKRRLGTALDHLYLARAVRHLLERGPSSEDMADTTADLSRVVPRVDVEAYRNNLSAIAGLCRENGVLPVFLLLRDNPRQAAPIREALAALAQGDTARAERELSGVVEQDEGDLRDLARLTLAESRRRLGGPAGPVPTLVKPSLDGQTVVRLDTDYNRVLREVAVAYGAEVVDGAAVLEATPDVFVDVCHFNEEGHRRVGRAVAQVVSRVLAP